MERGGEFVGTLELAEFPSPEGLAAETDEDLVRALRDFATHRLEDVVEDRAQGCGADYRVEPIEVVDLSIDGHPAVRYGFRGVEEGEATEMVVSYATVVDETLWIVVADAATDDGCMAAPELDVFEPAVLAEFLPTLDDAISRSVLP